MENSYRTEGSVRCRTCHREKMRANDELRRAGLFPCGHPRTTENSYEDARCTVRCRTCHRERQARFRASDPEAFRQAVRDYRDRNREAIQKSDRRRRRRWELAHLMYEQIRYLAMKDGLWPEARAERGAA